MKFAGRIALVAGAQQGIGAAISVALAEEGADVALIWLDNSRRPRGWQRASARPVAAPISSAPMSRGLLT